MIVDTIDENAFADIFPAGGAQQTKTAATFSAADDINVADILPQPNPADPAKQGAVVENQEVDANILDKKEETTNPKPTEGLGLRSYYEERIKAGKFVSIKDTTEDGKEVDFIPETPEDFDEVFEMQVDYRLQQKLKEQEQEWYESKSPAWKAIAQYSEMVDDPAQVIPFIQGVRTIESVSQVDENDIDGAEKIVRARLQQRGEDQETIEDQIDALKTSDKLITTAQRYKPMILAEERKQLAEMVKKEEQQKQHYAQMVHQIRDGAVRAIEAPVFGKQKLKNDEKAAVYDLIAEPDPQSKGYGIYTAIDKLFESGDFEKLTKIALVLAKEESVINYISTTASDKTAEGLQRKLRVANENRGSSSNNMEAPPSSPDIVRRDRYSQQARFGRN